MKSCFLRITAVFMAVILCVAMSACGKDDAGEESSSAFGQAASGEGNSTFAGNSTPVDPILPPDAESIAQPVGGGGDDTPGTLPNVSVTQGKPGSTAGKTTQQNNQTTTERETESRTVKVTIPEGYNIVQIAKKLEANGVCSATDFINTAQTYDFSYYPLVGSMPKKQYRAFKLEGYLFPDTYEFYKNMKPQDAVGKFLRGSKAVLANYPSSAKNLKNMDEILTLASIIEKEAKTNTDKKRVSAVLHNRLAQGMKLQVDATPVYLRSYIRDNVGKYKNLNSSYTAYCNAYNTYNSACKGLPAGPICNPGRSSINAAINPSTEAEYKDMLYFCSKGGTIYYAKTQAEHDANLKKYGIVIPSV
ncbi:MAG: endolytic transglycosylase MltG [Clostridiales bacterium]|nr:endolytic transglycosylase MltG [Clostridiales bacterium]